MFFPTRRVATTITVLACVQQVHLIPEINISLWFEHDVSGPNNYPEKLLNRVEGSSSCLPDLYKLYFEVIEQNIMEKLFFTEDF